MADYSEFSDEASVSRMTNENGNRPWHAETTRSIFDISQEVCATSLSEGQLSESVERINAILDAQGQISEVFSRDAKDDLYSSVEFRLDPTYHDEGGHIDQAQRVILKDGSLSWLKPSYGETAAREGIEAGSGVLRSLSTFEIDRALGLGVVPEVRLVRTELGDASLQSHAADAGRLVHQYDDVDVQRMAVLDYVTGQTDRHEDNYRSTDSGRPAAIDNGLCLSSSENDSIQSDFVVQSFNEELNSYLLQGVREASRDDLSATLERIGIDKAIVAGAMARLDEIRENGRITGRAWSGHIYSGDRRNMIK